MAGWKQNCKIHKIVSGFYNFAFLTYQYILIPHMPKERSTEDNNLLPPNKL